MSLDHSSDVGSAVEEGPARLDIGAPDFAERSFEHYAALRAGCPVHRAVLSDGTGGNRATAFLDRPLWLVTGHAATAAALVDDRLSIDPRRGLSEEELAGIGATDPAKQVALRNLLSLDPPDHTRLRKLVQPAFTGRAVERWRPRIERIAADLLDAAERAAADRSEVAPDRAMELVEDYALPLPIAVILELVGVPAGDRERVHAWAEDMLAPGAGADGLPDLTAVRSFLTYGRQLVADKRAAPGDDLLTRLVRAEQDGDRLDADELVAMIFLLILAGHITTVNLIASATHALLTYPGELAALRADPDLVAGAVEETLRCWGPVEVASERFATEDLDLAGVPVRRGEMVLPVLGAAGRDPARFADPDHFAITRPDAARHLAFGKGVHACLGAPLARLEGQIALRALFDRFPDLRLATGPEGPARRALPLRGLTRLPLRC